MKNTTDLSKSTINVVPSRNITKFPISPGIGSILSTHNGPLINHPTFTNPAINPFCAVTNNLSNPKTNEDLNKELKDTRSFLDLNIKAKRQLEDEKICFLSKIK